MRSAPTPFGRSAFGFGSSTPGLDSPSGTTTPSSAFPTIERSYFSHTRGDSSASIDSTGSATTRYTSKPSTPFSHSSQPSFAASSAPFSKKPSFASIRNAFKSGKNNDAPPMPSLEHSPYPVLKNPFNRSTSSLTHVAPNSSRGLATTPTSASIRPSTPGSADIKFGRSIKGKGHGYSKSQQSHSGSIFHTSDPGSDYGNPYPPPPVPRVPSAYGNLYRDDTEDDKVVMDPKTPSDFALHAVFIRFATSAEEKIDAFLRQPFDQEPLLNKSMGPQVDAKFDETLNSLGIIAQKHAKKVIGSVMRWRRSQHEQHIAPDIIDTHMAQHAAPNRIPRQQDIPGLLNERKSLAAIYITCRALIAVLRLLSRDALGDALGYSLEEITFEQFRKPDRKLHTLSVNHRINSELYATLLGHLANVRSVIS